MVTLPASIALRRLTRKSAASNGFSASMMSDSDLKCPADRLSGNRRSSSNWPTASSPLGIRYLASLMAARQLRKLGPVGSDNRHLSTCQSDFVAALIPCTFPNNGTIDGVLANRVIMD